MFLAVPNPTNPAVLQQEGNVAGTDYTLRDGAAFKAGETEVKCKTGH